VPNWEKCLGLRFIVYELKLGTEGERNTNINSYSPSEASLPVQTRDSSFGLLSDLLRDIVGVLAQSHLHGENWKWSI